MAVKFSNNFSTALASSISSSDTVIELLSVSGLPTLGAGDYTYLTFDTDTNSPTIEIVKVTAINAGTNEVTVTRAQDGTTASSFAAGTKVELRLSAILLNDVSDEASVTDWGDILNKPSLLLTNGDGSDLTDVRAETVEVTVKNVSGGSLAKGTPVHQTGTSGSATFEVVAADASNASVMPAHFVLLETLANQAEGRGLLMGRISGVDTSSFSEGDTIYVAVGGGYTNVAPAGEGNLIQNLGTVTRVDSTNGGGEVMGAGRSNATPNLNNGNIFIGNASNQATTASLSTSVSSLSHYNNTNWDTAYGWGNHASQGYATTTYVDTAVSNLVDAAPTTLDTLNELAAALGDDPNFATTVSNQIGLKQDASTALTTSTTFGGDVSGTYNAIVIADDSHNHVISNVDGLQAALDSKLTSSSALSASNITSGTLNNARLEANVFVNDGGTYSVGFAGDVNDVTGFQVLRVTGFTGTDHRAFANHHNMLNIPNTSSVSYVAQIGFETGGTGLRWRSSSNGTFTSWYDVWHSGNDGAGSSLDADLLDGQHGSYYYSAGNPPPYPSDADTVDGLHAASFLRSDASDSASGQITFTSTAQYPVIIDGNNNGKMVLRGSSSPYIRFQNGTTDQAFIQSTSSSLELKNQADSSSIRIKDDVDFSQDGTTYYSMWHAGNDGSGSGLDADLLDGVHAASFLRSDANDTTTGVITFSNVSDYQIVLDGAGGPWAGIRWQDSGGYDHLWYNGQNSTFAIGGGGSNVAGKKLHVHGGLSVGTSVAGTSTPTNGIYSEGALTVPLIYGSAGNTALELNHTTYTMISDPEGGRRIYIGDTGDAGNYYDNDVHYFRSRSSATRAVISGSGLNLQAGGYQVNGTTRINSVGDGLFTSLYIGSTNIVDTNRNLTNIGTISSGAITSSGGVSAGLDVTAGRDFALGRSDQSPAFIIENYNYFRLVANRQNDPKTSTVGVNPSGVFYTSTGFAVNSTTVINSLAQLKSPVTGNRNQGNILLGDSSASGTNKWATVAGTHYNQTTGSGNGSANAGVMIVGSHSTSTANEVYVGGGPYELNPATKILFSTHNATTHNLGGSIKATIDSSGNFDLTTGGYKVGGNTVIDASRNISSGAITANGDLYFSKSPDPRIYAGANVGLNVDGQALYLNRYTNSNILVGSGSAPATLSGINVHMNGSSYVLASNGTISAFIGADSSGYAMFGALTNHDAVIRANNTAYLRVKTSSNVDIVSGALEIGGNTAIDSSRNVFAARLKATTAVHPGSTGYWKLRDNGGGAQLVAEYSTSDALSDANIKWRVLNDGTTQQEGSLRIGSTTVIDSSRNISGASFTTGYGLQLNNGNTKFLLYNNAGENVLYMRDTTNGQMLTTWYTDKFAVNKALQVTGGDIEATAGKLIIKSSSNGFARIEATDQNHLIILRGDRDSTTTGSDKTTYYQYGGTRANGLGHLFYTGGNLASQTLKLGIHNDAIAMYQPLYMGGVQALDASRNLTNIGTATFNGAVTMNSSLNVASTIGIAGSTVIDSSRNVFAPLFYDSNDTGYYTDPTGTSNVNAFTATRIGVNPSGANNNGFGISLYSGYNSGEPTYGLMFQGRGTFGGHGPMGASDWATYFTMNNDTSRGWIFRRAGSGNSASITAGGIATFDDSVRTPIFYDSNNTAYYVDPSNTGVSATFNGRIETRGSSSINTTTPGTGSYQLRFTGQGTADYAQAITWDWATSGAQAGIYVQSSGAYGTKMYLATTDSFATGSKTALTIDHSGAVFTNRNYLQATGSVRAPIFYDSNDTSYLLDPSSTSRVYDVRANYLTRPGHAEGHLVGSYNNVGANSQYTNPIYTIGSSYNPTNSDLVDMYGIGYSHPNANYDGISSVLSGWGMYVAAGGQARIGLSGDDGVGIATNSWRAPIFYDLNNTNYYVDPASSSQLNTVSLGAGSKLHLVSLGDGNHFLRYISTGFSGVTIDGPQLGGHQGGELITNLGGDNWSFRWDYSGNTFSRASSRAPIFYDSDDTSLFLDPNSNSLLRNVYTQNGGYQFRPRYADGTDIYSGSFNWYGLQLGNNGSNYIVAGRTNPNGRLDIYVNNTSDFPSINGTHSSRFDSDGIFYNYYSVRSPIFYDYNDTSYYVDPNADLSFRTAGYVGSYRNDTQGILQSHNTSAGSPAQLNIRHSYGDVVIENYRGWLYLYGSAVQTNNSFRAPIFYDSDNTAYYVDPAGATSAKFAQFVHIGDSSSYATNSGSWGARLNVTDNVHAKIEVGQDANGMLSHWYAHTGQSSIKFGTSSSHDVEFQRGGATQLYLNSGYAGANNQFRAPIFYDSGNTGYYVDPASTSVLSTLSTTGNIFINNSSPTIYLQDTDNRSSMIHCNSNIFYVLRASGTNSTGWATYNGYWPMELSLETNDATFGNAITAVGNITAYSDARKKKDIRPLEGGLEYLSALDAKRYKWRVDDREDIGFIAQDVEAAGLDVFVIESERKDPDTGEHIESVKSLDYGRMVSVLWQAVKEQQTQIEAMAAEIKSLKEMKQ